MASEVIALDPFGRTIHLLPGIFFDEHESHEVYDNAATVIEKPAVVVEVTENNQTEFFYLRSVGWHLTLLITARLNNEQWEAYNCIKNPSSEMLLSVLKKGKQIF